MKRVIISFLLLTFIYTSAEQKAFAYSSDPEKFIEEIIDEAKIILSSGLSQDEKAEKLTL